MPANWTSPAWIVKSSANPILIICSRFKPLEITIIITISLKVQSTETWNSGTKNWSKITPRLCKPKKTNFFFLPKKNNPLPMKKRKSYQRSHLWSERRNLFLSELLIVFWKLKKCNNIVIKLLACLPNKKNKKKFAICIMYDQFFAVLGFITEPWKEQEHRRPGREALISDLKLENISIVYIEKKMINYDKTKYYITVRFFQNLFRKIIISDFPYKTSIWHTLNP